MCKCAICNRELTDPKSIDRGIGPECARKMYGGNDGGIGDEGYEDELLSTLLYPLDEYVILQRSENGVATNVPHIVERHSPDGYEWGYGGSGPADLALNICEYYVRILGNQGYTIGNASAVRVGVVHDVTYQIYQDFKWEFIATMERNGGKIPANTIMQWIKSRIPQQHSLFGGA